MMSTCEFNLGAVEAGTGHRSEGPREQLEGVYYVVSWVGRVSSVRMLSVWPSEGNFFKL